MRFFPIAVLTVCLHFQVHAQNPIVTDHFTADPSARVFEGKVYVYPSHDIPCEEGQGYIGFCMADYHVYSSEDLVEWKDHGVIVDQNTVPWVKSDAYGMWAPDCIYKDGKYYFYFPAVPQDGSSRRRIGVATADKPYGPFTPEPHYIEGMSGIDPNPFIDKDGQAYIYWGGGDTLYMAKLKDNMLELATEPEPVMTLPPKFKEGPYLFERNGIYYFTFPHVPHTTERLVYAMGKSPMGPFEYKGVIMDESPIKCWTNHHSIIEYQDQWYLFYHHNDLSPEFDKNRSMRIDSLFFNEDGTIRKVNPTLRGVGITKANHTIQVDRYSDIKNGNISFLDSANRSEGWKVTLRGEGAWVRYNRVDFGSKALSFVVAKVFSKEGGTFEIRAVSPQGPLVAEIKVSKKGSWTNASSKVKKILSGIYDIYIVNRKGEVEVDWISFR